MNSASISKTLRLTLRELQWADVASVHELHMLPATDEFNTLGIPQDARVTERIVQEWVDAQKKAPRVSYVFCVEITDSKQFIGLIALNLGKPTYRTAEVWYKIHQDFWKQGFALEALTELLEFGFITLKLHRIEAGCAVENIASSRLLEKVGMMQEGMKRKKLPIRGEWKDSFFYAMLEEDFMERQGKGRFAQNQ